MVPVQMRMARAALGWGVRELAEKAGVTANTVTRIENGADSKQSTMNALRQALESAGVEFIPSNGGGPGVRLVDPHTGTIPFIELVPDTGGPDSLFKDATSSNLVSPVPAEELQPRRRGRLLDLDDTPPSLASEPRNIRRKLDVAEGGEALIKPSGGDEE